MSVNYDYVFNWIRIAFLAGAIFYFFVAIIFPRLTASGRRYVRYFGVLLACASVASFPNFGVFHRPHYGAVHYWDAFHYYMGSKYLKELGYDGLYEATYVAGREHNVFGDIRHLRSLSTYTPVPVGEINEVTFKSRFTPERWEEFARDLSFFVGVIHQWPRLFYDHGYNDPPFRALLLGWLTNLVPLSDLSLHLLSLLDYLLIIIAFIAVFTVFGSTAGLLALSFFTLNFLARFNFIGGSILRWDWISALVLAACALASKRLRLAGFLLSYAAAARVFPLLFALPVIVKWLYQSLRERKLSEEWPFVWSFAFGLLGSVVCAFLFLPIPELLSHFAHKISEHGRSALINHIGFAQVVTYSSIPWSTDPVRGIHVPFPEATAIRASSWIIPLIALLGSLATVPLVLKNNARENFLLGSLFVYLLVTPANYYYSFLVLFFLLPYTSQGIHFVDAIKVVVLLSFALTGYLFEQQSSEMLPLYYMVSIQYGVFFLLSLGLDYMKLYSRQVSARWIQLAEGRNHRMIA